MAKADVVSSEIVGYQEIEIPTGYSMYTVTFKDVAGGEFDLSTIKLLNSASKEMDDDNSTSPTQRSRAKVMFQKIDLDSGNLVSTSYDYTSRNQTGWRKDLTAISAGEVTFKDGEGMYIYNNQGEVVKFLVSGKVALTPITTGIPSGYSIIGNMTPVRVDISKIKLLNSAKVEMNDDNSTSPTQRSRSKVFFQKLDATTGNLDATSYDYTSRNSVGWRKDLTQISEGAEYLEPGEAIYIYNTQGDTVYLQFPTVVQ